MDIFSLYVAGWTQATPARKMTRLGELYSLGKSIVESSVKTQGTPQSAEHLRLDVSRRMYQSSVETQRLIDIAEERLNYKS